MGKGTPVALSVRLHGNIEKSYEGDYDIAGTRGQSLSLEGFRVDRAPLPNITIRYHAYIRDVGDVPAVHVGEWVGFHGKELMAFSASLEGPDAHKYILRYMAHLEGTGDTGHHFGGDMCGSTDVPRRLEGLKMWLEEVPAVHSARETYVNCLEHILRQHKELDKRLVLLEADFDSADQTLSKVHRDLEAHLRNCNISSTASSAASMLGIILLFSPAIVVGGALMAAGAAASVGTTIAQSFFYESEASEAFTRVINSFASSSKSLQDTLADIEVAKENLIESLLIFRAALDAHPSSDPSPPTLSDLPSSGPGGGGASAAVPREPKLHYAMNGFSKLAFKGLAVSGGVVKAGKGAVSAMAVKSAGKLGELIGKTTGRIFGKAFPVLGIAIDTASIIDTWTSDNQTLKEAEQLRRDIAESVGAFRDAVHQCRLMMEDLLGSQLLQKSLRKLIKLRRPPPGPPSGPEKACKLFALMKAMVGLPLLLFASLQRDDGKDGRENKYLAYLIPQADMVQLSEMPTTAPVVDSVYERYPNIEDLTDADQPKDERGEPQQDFGSVCFRHECTFVPFGNMEVYNVDGSRIDRRVSSWVGYWEEWYIGIKGRCTEGVCYIQVGETPGHSGNILGGHMEKADRRSSAWYILPICNGHNSKCYDRYGTFGSPLITYSTAWAIKIPALF